MLDAMGRYKSFFTQVSCTFLAIILVFYILNVTSILQPVVYPLIDRVTYSTPFVEKHFINKHLDQILILAITSLWFYLSVNTKIRYFLSSTYGLAALLSVPEIIPSFGEILSLLSFPIIFALILLNRITKKHLIYFEKSIFIKLLSVLGIIIGILGLAISVIQITAPTVSLPSINYMYYFYLIFSLFSPILLIMIGLSFPIKMLVVKISNNKHKRNNTSHLFSIFLPFPLKVHIRILSLVGIIALALVIVGIPHIHTVNKDNQIIGSDTKDYERLLRNMSLSTSISEFINAFIAQIQEDRSLSLLTFFLLSQILDPSNLVNSLELLPLVLAPLLILSIYYVTMELTSNHFTSILSSFLSAISFHVLIGMYGGLYANWFTLIFVNLTILFLMRSLRRPSKGNMISFSVILSVVLLSHEPTWPIITLVILIFLTVILIFKPYLKRTIYYLFLAIIPSFFIELFKTIVMKQSGVIKNVSFASSQGLGFHDVNTIWSNLIASTQTYLAGQFSNSIIFGLVIYWVSTCSLKDKSNILIIIFLSIIILPIMFGDPEVISRVMYEIPFQIPAAIALTQLKKNYGNMLFITICLWLVALSIRASSNFYFDVPT